MTNDDLDRLTRLHPSSPADRAELDAAITALRTQGGREALLADAIRAALRYWDDGVTATTAEYVRTIANLQGSAS